jgi:hypothetical protein
MLTHFAVYGSTSDKADHGSAVIYKFAPDGTRSPFNISGVGSYPLYLAIQPAPAISYAAQVQQPINADGTSVFNVRRGVVPVKFTLTQGGVATCALPPATIAVTRTARGYHRTDRRVRLQRSRRHRLKLQN